MEQYEVIPRKYGNNLWINIPKKIIKKEKINPKHGINVLVSKNLMILYQNKH